MKPGTGHTEGRGVNGPWRALTGGRWRRAARGCPTWCGGGHLCTARLGYPKGEHRSEPITVQTTYGVIVCTRVQTLAGRGRLELRLQVDLSLDEDLATVQAVHVADEVDQAVRVALATATGWLDVGDLLGKER